MEFIKGLLKSTLKGECELPKVVTDPKLNEIHRVIEDDTYLEYGELVIRRTQFNLYHKWCEVKYRGVKVCSMDKELYDLVGEVAEYVNGEEIRRCSFSNLSVGKMFSLGNKRFKVIEGVNCNECYFKNHDCKKMREEGILPKCNRRKDDVLVVFKEVK